MILISFLLQLFLRGKPHLQNYMRRLPKTHKKLGMKKKDEPNFYKLNQTHPLPALHEAPIPGAAAVQVMCNRIPHSGSPQLDSSSNLSPITQQQQNMMIVTPNVSPQHAGPGIMGGNNFMPNGGVGNGSFLGSNMAGMGGMNNMGPGNFGMGGMSHVSQGNMGMNGRSGMGIGPVMGQGGMSGMGSGNMSGAQGRFGGFNDIDCFKDDYDLMPLQPFMGRGVGNSMGDQSNFINPMMGSNGGFGGNNGYSNSGLSMKNAVGMGQSNSLDLNPQWQSDYYQGYSQQAMMPSMQSMQQHDMYSRSLALADDFSTASSGGGAIGLQGAKLLGGSRH
jgi:hypothetical protein